MIEMNFDLTRQTYRESIADGNGMVRDEISLWRNVRGNERDSFKSGDGK